MFIGSATNSDIRALNKYLQDLASEFSFPYIDLHSHFLDAHHQLDAIYRIDGIHLNGIAYQRWANALEPLLKADR